MATSTLCQSSPLGSPSGSPRSCLYMPRSHSLQPKADWRASFADSNSENRAAAYRGLMATKPLILRQHNGFCPIPKPVQPELHYSEEKATKASPSKSRLSLERALTVLRCHVCQSTVKEQDFHKHLFFGAIRCELCFTICQNCRDLEWINTEAEVGGNKCQHKFIYCEDPYEYLLPRLCGSDDHDMVGSSTLPHKLRVLQNYLTKLVSLQLREPWSSALRTCKKHLLRAYTKSDSEPSVEVPSRQDPLPVTSIMEDSHDSKTVQEESEKLNSDTATTMGRFRSPSPERRDSRESEDSEDGLLLTQSYDLEHLEQEVEYVELENNKVLLEQGLEEKLNYSRKPKKRRKTSNHKKTNRSSEHKKRTPSPVHESQEEEGNLVMEEVELPEDGYYLMVREAVEECPMCFEPLCPSMCTVNIRTFLFTVRCPECSLIIYMVPDLPDGIKIVTENMSDNAGGMHKESEKSKTKTNVNPKVFFAR